MSKAEQYRQVKAQLRSIVEGVPNFTAALASAAALLHDTFDHYFWTGFYLPDAGGSLVVGPYQGPLACIVLPAGKGVCARAATTRETIVVPDVHAFADHIACDARSESEIVVPVIAGDELRAILDVDAEVKNAFDDVDAAGLEAVARILADC